MVTAMLKPTQLLLVFQALYCVTVNKESQSLICHNIYYANEGLVINFTCKASPDF